MHPDQDMAEYFQFTTRSRLDKAVHILEGLVRGIGSDGHVSANELSLLAGWIGEHERFADRHPFNEVLPVLNAALLDSLLDEEERQDLLWLCERLTSENAFFDKSTSDMQRLQGMMGGIAADGEITKDELEALRAWMDEHQHLQTCWPYDELAAITSHILRDGHIDEQEHRELLGFFSDFFAHSGHRAISVAESCSADTMRGVCALDPAIEFSDRLFCFTGSSERFTRRELATIVEDNGGRYSNSVTKELDYLIIGADGNPCWAFACYGRKVEAAVRNRKAGHRVLLVHEYDFWDCVEDSGASSDAS